MVPSPGSHIELKGWLTSKATIFFPDLWRALELSNFSILTKTFYSICRHTRKFSWVDFRGGFPLFDLNSKINYFHRIIYGLILDEKIDIRYKVRHSKVRKVIWLKSIEKIDIFWPFLIIFIWTKKRNFDTYAHFSKKEMDCYENFEKITKINKSNLSFFKFFLNFCLP